MGGRLIEGAKDLLALLFAPELLVGLGIGLLAAVVGWLLADWKASNRPPIGAALAAVLVGVWLFTVGRAPIGVVVAMPVLALSGGTRQLMESAGSRAGVSLLGATALVLGIEGGPVFRLAVLLGVAGAVFVVSAAEMALDDRVPTAALFAAAALALVIGIPEIDRALVLAGSLIPFAVLGFGGRRLGRAGAATYPALFVWIAVADGATAQGSVIGVIAALGLLALGSLAPRLVAGRNPVFVTIAQIGWAVFASRVAGVRRGLVPAIVILLFGGALALLLAKSKFSSGLGSASQKSWEPD